MEAEQYFSSNPRAFVWNSTISIAPGISISICDSYIKGKGEVVSIYTPSRYREVSGKYEPTPWKGRFSGYINVNGYLIPQEGKVEWHLKDQGYPYWKAGLREIRYD